MRQARTRRFPEFNHNSLRQQWDVFFIRLNEIAADLVTNCITRRHVAANLHHIASTIIHYGYRATEFASSDDNFAEVDIDRTKLDESLRRYVSRVFVVVGRSERLQQFI